LNQGGIVSGFSNELYLKVLAGKLTANDMHHVMVKMGEVK